MLKKKAKRKKVTYGIAHDGKPSFHQKREKKKEPCLRGGEGKGGRGEPLRGKKERFPELQSRGKREKESPVFSSELEGAKRPKLISWKMPMVKGRRLETGTKRGKGPDRPAKMTHKKGAGNLLRRSWGGTSSHVGGKKTFCTQKGGRKASGKSNTISSQEEKKN